MRLAVIWLAVTLVAGQQRPPTPRVTATTIRSSDVPASPVAVVTYMVRGQAETASDLLFVVWRGQADWYRRAPRSSSGGGSGSSFSATVTYGTVHLDLHADLPARVATVQGVRVDLGDSNVILVDDVDRPKSTRVVKTLRIEPSGPVGAGPNAPLRLLGSSMAAVEFLGCGEPAGRPAATVPAFCWMVVGPGGKQE